MKTLKYLAALLVAATLFASCEKSDEDMPQLDFNSSKAPVLADLSEPIDGSQSEYTFYFTPGKFVVDGKEVVIAEKDQKQQYALQADLSDGDFSAPVTIARQNYDETDQFVVSYDALCSAVSGWKELATPLSAWTGTLKFRLLLLPGVNLADGFSSNTISVSTKMKYVDPNPKIYVCNNAGWDELRLYAWGDDNSALGDWPGIAPEDETVELGGKVYYAFDVKNRVGSNNENYIINNNDNGSQLDIYSGVFGSSVYVTINADGTVTIDSAEETKPEDDNNDDKQEINLPNVAILKISGNKITLETDLDAVYSVWAWNGDFGGEVYTESGSWPGDNLLLISNNDGKYVYEYTFTNLPEGELLPAQIIISTDGGNAKLFDGANYEDNAEYEYTKPDAPDPVDPELLDNMTFTFKTEVAGDYYVWAWGGNYGGEAFTEAGSWPGDKLELVSENDGEYIYGYKFTKNPGIAPTNIIISTDNGNTKFYDGVEFENGKEY